MKNLEQCIVLTSVLKQSNWCSSILKYVSQTRRAFPFRFFWLKLHKFLLLRFPLGALRSYLTFNLDLIVESRPFPHFQDGSVGLFDPYLFIICLTYRILLSNLSLPLWASTRYISCSYSICCRSSLCLSWGTVLMMILLRCLTFSSKPRASWFTLPTFMKEYSFRWDWGFDSRPFSQRYSQDSWVDYNYRKMR